MMAFRWMQQRSKLWRSTYFYSRGYANKPKGGHRGNSRPHLLLYGSVAFAWEKERISNEDVMSCVKEYMQRVSRQREEDDNNMKDVVNNASSSHHALPDPAPFVHPSQSPKRPSDAAKSAHSTSKQPYANSGSHNGLATRYDYSSWVLGWFSSSPSSSLSQPSMGPHHPKANSSPPPVEPSRPCKDSTPSSGFLDWSWRPFSWFAFGSAYDNKDGDEELGVLSGGIAATVATPPTTAEVKESEEEEMRRRREAMIQECMQHYQVYRREYASRYALSGNTRPLRRGMRAIEHAGKATGSKVAAFLLSSARHFCSVGLGEHYCDGVGRISDNCDDNDDDNEVEVLARLSTWGSVGGALDGSGATPTPWNGDGGDNRVSYFMQVELVDEAEVSETTPPGESALSAASNDESLERNYPLVEAWRSFADDVKLVLLTSQEYLNGQFELMFDDTMLLGENSPLSQLPPAPSLLRQVVAETSNSLVALLPEALGRRVVEFAGHRIVAQARYGDEVTSAAECQSSVGSLPSAALQERNDAHLHLSGRDFATTELKASLNSSEYEWDWEYINGNENYSAYRKLYRDTGLFQYKVIGHYDDVTAKDFLDAQVDNKFRRSWDEYADTLVTVENDETSNCRLIHWIMKYPFPMSNREYLFVQRSWISPKQDTIVIMNRSTLHPSYPEVSRYVRVKDYSSRMVIRACTKVDRLGMDFELTYFDDPQSRLPSTCVNWVATTAMPDFMEKIHSAALTKQHKD